MVRNHGFHLVFLLLALLVPQRSSGSSDVISDIGGSTDLGSVPNQEARALEIKSEEFWRTILNAAEKVKLVEHFELYKDAEALISSLAPDDPNRVLLSEGLSELRQADVALWQVVVRTADVAADRLAEPTKSSGGLLSLVTGGVFARTLAEAVRRFVGESDYADRLKEHVLTRQKEMVPILNNAKKSTSDIVGHALRAREPCYKLMVPTMDPTRIERKMAMRIIKAALEVNGLYLKFATDSFQGMWADKAGNGELPEKTVLRASLKRTARAEESKPEVHVSATTGEAMALV